MFVKGRFRYWNKNLEGFSKHVEGVKSARTQALQKFESFKNQKASIPSAFYKQSEQAKIEYRTSLTASLQCLKFLLRQGLPTRGHDEKEESSQRGNFLELLKWYADNNDDVASVVFKNAPGNSQMTSPKIQKDLRDSQAKELEKALDVGDLETGSGLNQELGLARPGDTRWGSHYKTLLNVLALYPSVVHVLLVIGNQSSNSDDTVKAETIMYGIESFHFAFMLHFMVGIFALTNELSHALQKKGSRYY